MKRVAVVTGTTSGIGYYIASYFKNEGYCVVGIQRGKAKHVDLNIEADLSKINTIPKIIDTIDDHYGRIDVLVNNAGKMDFEEYKDNSTVDLNMVMPIQLAEIAIHYMEDGGHIINIASISGITGDSELPIYSATKAAIINFTQSMAKRLAPRIRVNCISPGFFNTNLVEGDTPAELIEQVPMKREADPSEIIPVIHMLQVSTYMTGANIVIDGGLSL